jgi:hypothetical protein
VIGVLRREPIVFHYADDAAIAEFNLWGSRTTR